MKSKFLFPLFFGMVSIFAAGCDSQSPQTLTQQVALPPPQSQVAPTPQPQVTQQAVPAPTQVSQVPAPAVDNAAFGPLEVHFMSGPYNLAGYVWKPAGTGPFPTIIYNHGSNKDPNIGGGSSLQYFADHGYVVVVPIRRGHGDSEGPYIADLRIAAAPADRNQVVVDQLSAQVDDVTAGLNYAKSLSYVDTNRIAVAGCSYGGIETLLTSPRDLGLKAAVDFAGASESWAGSSLLQTALTQAVDASKLPIFFIQAQNDYNTTPTIVLSGEMAKLQKPYEEKIYPPFGVTQADGHGGFCSNGSNVWGPDVLAFLDKYVK